MSPVRRGRLSCIAITGPTACGKTDLALALAATHPVEVISMDSAMVYRGMDIGTAKPDEATRQSVPHHLISILEPEDSYSAGRFASDASRLVADIWGRGRVPLVVGGTMLYLKALSEGIAPLPERDAAVRAEIDARAATLGWPVLHAELGSLDPEAAARIEPTDRQRIQRALEVHAVTGRPLSALQAARCVSATAVEALALIPPDRAALGQTIEARFTRMVEQGFVDEVRRLRARPRLTADSSAMRAVGYRQVWAYLDGRWDWDEAARRAVTATRQLAKRQLTWLKRNRPAHQAVPGSPGLLDWLKSRVEYQLKGS